MICTTTMSHDVHCHYVLWCALPLYVLWCALPLYVLWCALPLNVFWFALPLNVFWCTLPLHDVRCHYIHVSYDVHCHFVIWCAPPLYVLYCALPLHGVYYITCTSNSTLICTCHQSKEETEFNIKRTIYVCTPRFIYA